MLERVGMLCCFCCGASFGCPKLDISSGASSIINSLKRSRACSVGAIPGVTKLGVFIAQSTYKLIYVY